MAGWNFPDYRLQQVEAQGHIPSFPGMNINAPAGAFGATEAQAIMQAGDKVSRAGDVLAGAAVREFKEANDARIDELNNQYLTGQIGVLSTGKDAFYTKQGADAIHGAPVTVERLGKLREDTMGQAVNEYQRRTLGARLDFHVADASSAIGRHVANQSLVWRDQVAKGKVLLGSTEMVINANDPDKVAVHAAGVWQTEYDRALKQIGDPDAAKASANAVRSNALAATITRLAVADPNAAKRMFDQFDKAGQIDATDAPKLAATIKDASNHRKAQDIVNLVSATGGVSPNYNEKVGGAENKGSYQGENSIGALGKYQMIPSTYTGLAQETDWGKGKSQTEIRAQLLDPATGPKKQDELQGKYNDRSVTALGKATVPVNDLTLYTTHFLGHGAGPEILKLPDDTPLQAGLLKAHGGDVKQVQAVNAANPFLAKVETVGDLKVLMAQKIGAPQTLATTGSPTKPNLDAMLASGLALAGNDPDTRDKVSAAIKSRYATDHAIYLGQIGGLEKQAFAHINAGGTIENLPPQVRGGLDSDSLIKVGDYEARVLEKRRKDKQQESGRGLADLERLGQLTEADVVAQRNNLPENEYRSWLKTSAGKGRTDDNGTYEQLQRGLNTRNMKDDIYNAFNAGDISTESRDALLAKNELFQKEGAPATPYKLGHDYVTRALDPGLMGGGISREIAARGIKEFDQYVAQNPQRETETQEQYAKRLDLFAQDSVKRHSLIKTSEMVLAIPVPANTPFQRSEMTTLPKADAIRRLGASEAELEKKFNEGKITKDQWDQDTIVLSRWHRFLDERVDPTPAPAPKK